MHCLIMSCLSSQQKVDATKIAFEFKWQMFYIYDPYAKSIFSGIIKITFDYPFSKLVKLTI